MYTVNKSLQPSSSNSVFKSPYARKCQRPYNVANTDSRPIRTVKQRRA